MPSNIKLSIIICTYNRHEILKDCLSSIELQYADKKDLVEVIIVDNFPIKNEELIIMLPDEHDYEIVLESKAGLSIARNRGAKQALGKWLAFIDDDALLSTGFLNKAIEIIDSNQFDCFGGGINSWWRYGKPKWILDTFGTKPQLLLKQGILKDGFNWGSNLFIKKMVLEKIGGFPEEIGMIGHKIGYSGENWIQKKLREENYIVGYDPDLIIDHLVVKQKLKLNWHVRSAYATARDGRPFFPEDYTYLGYSKTLRRIIAAPIKGSVKVILQKDYFLENWYLDSAIAWAQLFGKISAQLFHSD